MHADKALYSPGYLAFYVKPLCRISASCWMQLGCGTYLLQPRCACNSSLSPLPPSYSGGCLEHGPQLCVCVCVWVGLYMCTSIFICLSFFKGLYSNCQSLLTHAYLCVCVCGFICLHSLSLCILHHLSLCMPRVYTILIKVIKDLTEVLYILMIAVHVEHLSSTYFCTGSIKLGESFMCEL